MASDLPIWAIPTPAPPLKRQTVVDWQQKKEMGKKGKKGKSERKGRRERTNLDKKF